MKHKMKQITDFLKKHNIVFTALMLSAATLLAFLFQYLKVQNDTNSALLYILAVILIARWTQGYRYGLIASGISVLFYNFFFTYPYFTLNFTLTGYPIFFITMFTISIITSASTSNLKQQALTIAERERQLLEADKEKMRANLLRAVSHDLRTPLTGIIGAASSYTANYDSYTEEEKKNLVHNIYEDANWLLNMVENLLSVTRIQNDCQKVTTSPEVVEEVVAEAITRLKKRFPDAEISVSTPHEFLMIHMDAMLIEQVIINLLENALIHAQSDRPPFLVVESQPKQVVFHVYDYGKGIEESRLPTLFDGSSDTPTPTNLRKGMGIGLSICKTIILAHNGTIAARNHSDGAEFYFTLPKEEYHESEI